MKNKKYIKQIQARLKRALLNTQICNRGFTGENGEEKYLSDDIIELRQYGVDIKLPTSFSCGELGGMIYKELCSEVIRQIECHLHPFKRWIANHIDILISIAALIVSIISLCK